MPNKIEVMGSEIRLFIVGVTYVVTLHISRYFGDMTIKEEKK
jgi:hypothetical protein